jgi:lipoprotein-releasing system ATP-binding protein
VSLTIRPRDRVIVLNGTQGPGELLQRLLTLVEPPESGSLLVQGEETAGLNEQERARLRNRVFAYLHTAPFLLPEFTLIENVAVPLFKVQKLSPHDAHHRALDLLDLVELRDVASAKVGMLSRYDAFRVAVARALANNPAVLSVDRLDPDFSSCETVHAGELLARVACQMNLALIRVLGFVHLPEPGETMIDVLGEEISVYKS